MKIKEFKMALQSRKGVEFFLENGTPVAAHFHITEVGLITRHFIDCGGTLRADKKANLQLWEANDVAHRLEAVKLLKILETSESLFGIENLEIEVEYQQNTIGKFGLALHDGNFVLTATQTNCLAQDQCGIPILELPVETKVLGDSKSSSCTPGGGCC